jgi:hypothetical protein
LFDDKALPTRTAKALSKVPTGVLGNPEEKPWTSEVSYPLEEPLHPTHTHPPVPLG